MTDFKVDYAMIHLTDELYYDYPGNQWIINGYCIIPLDGNRQASLTFADIRQGVIHHIDITKDKSVSYVSSMLPQTPFTVLACQGLYQNMAWTFNNDGTVTPHTNDTTQSLTLGDITWT